MTTETQNVSILLVDDHPVVRQGYRRVLENQGDFRVVAEADNATGAYAAFKAHAPDVVVMDISMKGASGLEAIRNIRSRNQRARILVFSMHSEAALVKAAFGAGASGYVTKSSEPAALIRAIRSVVHGERAMSDDVAHTLAEESLNPSQSILDRLGEREIEILRQLAAGSTTEQIAANLNLSTKTVQNYHYMVKAKTGLHTDAQLVRLAVACGLTNL
jgi:two-component system invasion response regulator UvrY